MSDVNPELEVETAEEEAPKEFTVTIKISDQNLQYKSDFNEAETVFWLEAVKDLIIKNAFNKANLEKN